MLSQEIVKSFHDVLGCYVEDYDRFDLETFEENKQEFFEDFGNQLILTKEVKITFSDDYKVKQMRKCVQYDLSSALADLVISNGVEGFFTNKIMSNLSIKTPEEVIKVPVGMKLSKAFGLFIKSELQLHRNQTAYSQYIGTTEIAGKLCLSCHPLDYLSISMNTHGWGSCQSLTGDYAAGTLSILNDKVTLVAYLHNGNMFKDVFTERSGVEWNSKKWRVLVHIDKSRNLVLFSKNYPFDSTQLEEEVLNMIKDIYPDQGFGDLQIEGSQEVLNKYMGNGMHRVNYNDLLYYKGRFAIGKSFEQDGGAPERILIGHEATCCVCGETHIEDAYTFSCYSCSPSRCACDSCGEHGFHEDDMYYMNNDMLCGSCYDECYAVCDECEEVIHVDDLRYLSETDCSYCEDCYQEVILDFEEDEEDEEQERF